MRLHQFCGRTSCVSTYQLLPIELIALMQPPYVEVCCSRLNAIIAQKLSMQCEFSAIGYLCQISRMDDEEVF